MLWASAPLAIIAFFITLQITFEFGRQFFDGDFRFGFNHRFGCGRRNIDRIADVGFRYGHRFTFRGGLVAEGDVAIVVGGLINLLCDEREIEAE